MKRGHIALLLVIGIIVIGCALAAGIVAIADATAHHTTPASDPVTTSVEQTMATPTTEASADDRMNDFLDQHGNPADQHERMRDTAREVCSLLGTTHSYNDQVTILESQANMSEAAAKVFLNASINIYCPVYVELIPR